MYKLLLILKYLRKRRIAWVSLIAVTLCTAMVLVVISVMGGWLRMFEDNFHGLSGDVLVSAKTLRGFAYYDRIIDRLEKLPEVEAAAPIIKTYGLINIGKLKTDGVQVLGYPLDKIGKINRFPQSLYFQYQHYLDEAQQAPTAKARQELERQARESLGKVNFANRPLTTEEYRRAAPRSDNWPGLIIGAGLLEIRKGMDGSVQGRDLWKYALPVKLILFNADSRSITDPDAVSQRAYWIADDSRTQVWQYDSTTVYVPFDLLQQDLGMQKQQETNEQTGARLTRPARCSEVHIKLKDGVEPRAAKLTIQKVVDKVFDDARREELAASSPEYSSVVPVVETWRESQAMWISAVEHEKVLVVFLFSIISVVAIFLIFCIFYMIVVEKTRDIGIIKSVGATASGVAGIFLGYGAAIGIVGGGSGFVIGYLIIHNINFLHQKMGELMGIQIWNPEVYVFDTIPNQVNPREAFIIVSVAIISSVAGAVIPAIRAARLNPVEAVRYE